MMLRPVISLNRRIISSRYNMIRVTATEHAYANTAGGSDSPPLIRAEKSGKCRFCFLPEEWFTFFHVKTGVSGFYVFLMGLANYCISKEVYVMEHEYYTGLSLFIMVWFGVTRIGPKLGANLDKQVDEITESWTTERKQEIAANEEFIKAAELAQRQAQGQKMLMDAKKENILMQLEAVYRERAMQVYRMVKGRMEYHMKIAQVINRIHQKWMVSYILRNVMQSITPEFEASALNRAIKEIEEVASRA